MPHDRALRGRAQPHPGQRRRRRRAGGHAGRAVGRLTFDDGVLPPFGEPSGPAFDDDDALLREYARRGVVGHSARFRIEGPVLLTSADAAAALWIGDETLLVRADLPADDGHRAGVEGALRAAGFALLDEDTLFAPAIAIQALGIRFSSWDLWGTDLEAAFACLRQVAAGEGDLPVVPGPTLPGPDLPFEPFRP